LRSVFHYNYIPDLSENECVVHIYALNDEAGVVTTSYPHGKRPALPIYYFSAVVPGAEYQFAAHLIYEGMLTEGLTVAESVRLRYDGERRNPWNEPECGHHYARAMSAWALVVALSGFHYSGVDRKVTLTPRVRAQNFRCFWSVPSGWGIFSQTMTAASQSVQIETFEGSMGVASLALGGNGKAARKKVSARLGKEPLAATLCEEGKLGLVAFDREVRIVPGLTLAVSLRA
jgi:hypothetical protein